MKGNQRVTGPLSVLNSQQGGSKMTKPQRSANSRAPGLSRAVPEGSSRPVSNNLSPTDATTAEATAGTGASSTSRPFSNGNGQRNGRGCHAPQKASNSSASGRKASVSVPGSHDDSHTFMQEYQHAISDVQKGAAYQKKMELLLVTVSCQCTCSRTCKCADLAGDLLRDSRRLHSIADKEDSRGTHMIPMLMAQGKLLPAFAAKLLDPAAGHQLVAAQGRS